MKAKTIHETSYPEYTDVLFRRYHYEDGHPEIVAIFPGIKESPGLYSCYAHIGQHSSCSRGIVNDSKPATEEEYAPLKRELESPPYEYKLRVLKRWPKEC